MRCYAIAEIEVVDPGWVDDYVANVTGLVEASGGRYLARTPRVEQLEGEPRTTGVFVIIEWRSEEAARAFYESSEYAPYRRGREQGARNDFVLVAGEDISRTARIEDTR